MCGKEILSIDHEIDCSACVAFRIRRHDYVVNKITCGIDNEKKPRKVSVAEKNYIKDAGRPDIEFYIKGKQFILDVVYAREDSLEASFKKKIDKYKDNYAEDRIIPLVIRHNATVYEPSMMLIGKYLPEISKKYLGRYICISTVRYDE